MEKFYNKKKVSKDKYDGRYFIKPIYCKKCLYPFLSASPMEINDEGICMGCITTEIKNKYDQKEYSRRELLLKKLIDNRLKFKEKNTYDCIVSVSGGKDSYYQTHYVRKILGLKPLLVTYNGNNYSKTGLRNVQKMREVFGFDHIFFTPAVDTLKKLNRLGMLIMGDMDWHNHIGIFTYPIKVAVEKNIPIMIWGEHGDTDLGGMYGMDDMIEFSYRERTEHAGRGYDWNNIVELSNKYNEPLNKKDMYSFIYPEDSEIDRVGIRGIFMNNYIYWEANDHLKLMIEKYDFKVSNQSFERTYRKGSNLDDIHENGIHDYLKYIKFGYGRCTDHASKDIRAGLISRDQGIRLVNKMDPIKPKDLERWLKYVGMEEEEFDRIADHFRDPRVWKWSKEGKWQRDFLKEDK